MPYRKHPFTNRKYLHSDSSHNIENPIDNPLKEDLEKIDNIPLPNESENGQDPAEESEQVHRTSFLSTFTKNLRAEEIILLGLLLLLLVEGIQDEFLFILLIYIFLA